MNASKNNNNASASLGILEGMDIDISNDNNTKENIHKNSNTSISNSSNTEKSKRVKEDKSIYVNEYNNKKTKEVKSKIVNTEKSKISNTKKKKAVNVSTEKRSFMLTQETVKKLGLLDIAIKDKNLSQLVDAAIDVYFTKNKKAVNEILKMVEDTK
ncbi:hypothetical protein [Clostridium sp. DL1XJH146]